MTHPSTLTLHRHRYGELSGPENDALMAHVADCELCSGRLNAQTLHREAFQLTPVPEALRSSPPSRSRWAWAMLPLLVAAMALVAIRPGGPPAPDEAGQEIILTKGTPASVEVWVQDGRTVRVLYDGDAVRPGNRIQLRYRLAPARWLTLAGIDASGAVEIYGTWRALAEEGGWHAAPVSLTLDEETGIQRVYAVFTPQRPADTLVQEALLDAPPARTWVEGLKLRVGR